MPQTIEVIKEVEKVVEVPIEKIVERIIEKPVEVIREVEKIVEVPVEKIVERIVIKEVPVEVIREAEKPNINQTVDQSILDQLSAQPDTFDPFATKGTASFGTAWPAKPAKGDLFLKVDSKPNKLYKWNGRKWIEIDRQRVNDTLVYDVAYIDYIIDQVRRGLRDYEDLSEIEKSQVIARIKDKNN